MRIKEPDIIALRTARLIIKLKENQYFCSTDKAYEIWDENNSLRRIIRIPKNRVLSAFIK